MPPKSKTPVYMRRCVASLVEDGYDTNAAFAICNSSMQKAGYLTAGRGQRETAKGRKRKRQMAAEAITPSRDVVYEEALEMARKNPGHSKNWKWKQLGRGADTYAHVYASDRPSIYEGYALVRPISLSKDGRAVTEYRWVAGVKPGGRKEGTTITLGAAKRAAAKALRSLMARKNPVRDLTDVKAFDEVRIIGGAAKGGEGIVLDPITTMRGEAGYVVTLTKDADKPLFGHARDTVAVQAKHVRRKPRTPDFYGTSVRDQRTRLEKELQTYRSLAGDAKYDGEEGLYEYALKNQRRIQTKLRKLKGQERRPRKNPKQNKIEVFDAMIGGMIEVDKNKERYLSRVEYDDDGNPVRAVAKKVLAKNIPDREMSYTYSYDAKRDAQDFIDDFNRSGYVFTGDRPNPGHARQNGSMAEYGTLDAMGGLPPTKIGQGNREYMKAYNEILAFIGEKPLPIKKPPKAYLDALQSGRRKNPGHSGRRKKSSTYSTITDGYGNAILHRLIDMGYTPLRGMEGPFMMNGYVAYYDMKEGQYYSRDNDMYYSAMGIDVTRPRSNPPATDEDLFRILQSQGKIDRRSQAAGLEEYRETARKLKAKGLSTKGKLSVLKARLSKASKRKARKNPGHGLKLGTSKARKDLSDTLKDMKKNKEIRAKNKGDFHTAMVSAAYYAMKQRKAMYVYGGNSYMNKIYRVSSSASEYLNPVNNTDGFIMKVMPSLLVTEIKLTRNQKRRAKR